jgi:hypothetical protein
MQESSRLRWRLAHLPAAMRRKVVCENAARLYGFPLNQGQGARGEG